MREEREEGSTAIEATGQHVVAAALAVHRALGPGLLESAYEACLAHELESRGRLVHRQLVLPVVYGGLTLDEGYRLDLLVDDEVVIEVKAVAELSRVHEAQVLTYLRLSGKQLGFLINFHVPVLKEGLRRYVRTPNFAPFASPLRSSRLNPALTRP